MRIRLKFSKFGKVRFTSHRDVARMWERAVRRSGLPMAYSEGFNPRPRLSFGLALSTCHESQSEYLDIDIDPERADQMDMAELLSTLTQHLPDGLAAIGAEVITRKTPSLQQAVTSCTWQIDVTDTDEETAAGAAARALAADELVVTRQRKGKEVTDDLRPQLIGIDIIGPTEDGVRIVAELGTKPRSIRPSELLSVFEPPLRERRVTRLNQWITDDLGERREPIACRSEASAAVGAT